MVGLESVLHYHQVLIFTKVSIREDCEISTNDYDFD